LVPAKSPREERVRVIQDRWLAYGTVPLRFFLGITFVYAGVQKIADPGFLRPGAVTYIGTQLQAFAVQSPIAFLIESVALPAPALTGVGVIAAEIAIGAAAVLGVATRWSAIGGALVNFMLFLTASWSVQPYFLGSDGVFTVAWITLAMVGDQGILTAGPYILRQLGLAPDSAHPPRYDPDRRRLLVELGAAAVGLVWLLSVLPRAARVAVQAGASPGASPSASPAATPSATPNGTRIGTIASLQSQGSLLFQDPATGDPAYVVQLRSGSVVAFDAVCTHAGCQVNYDTGSRLFICPCHGAEFDPAQSAAVVAGPAPTPLPTIGVQVAADGGIYTG
jgi:thiosulfate dehydrogenase [quinone] large subunit